MQEKMTKAKPAPNVTAPKPIPAPKKPMMPKNKMEAVGEFAEPIYDLMDVDAQRAENAAHMKRVFSKFDVLIGPTLPVLPFNTNDNTPTGFEEDELFSWLPFTYPFNLTKNPACSLNVNFSNSGLPIGMQIVANVYDDKKCFDLAYIIEKLMQLHTKWPKL